MKVIIDKHFEAEESFYLYTKINLKVKSSDIKVDV